MYIPASFAETDIDTLHGLMRRYNFATLISSGIDAPFATHLPFLLDADSGPNGTLITHLARANPHWKLLSADQEALVIFQGAHSYISPTWYDPPALVPTWNYAVVHAYGKPRIIHDAEWLKKMVRALVDYHEGDGKLPGLETNFPDNLLQAIVGIEIPIARLEGKFKFNQNRSVADQQGVIAALEQAGHPDQQTVANIMRQNIEQLPTA